MKRSLGYLALFLVFLVPGCSDDEQAPPEENVEKPSAPTEPVEEDLGPPLEGEPTVAVWDWSQTLEAVHQHQGKVVVLHVWATWNEDLDDPAHQGAEGDRERQMENLKLYGFEEFVRMKKLLRDDVVTISLNTDYNVNTGETPDRLQEKVLDFARERGANFQHGVSSIPEEQLQEQLEIIGTPAALVFDKKGELRQTFFHDEEPFSYRKDVIPLVKTLIKEEYTPPAGGGEKADKNEVSVKMGTWKDMQTMVAGAKGRVVVVDLWSTQCGPCLKEFPNLVKLHNERKKDVACFSFNMDYIGKGKPEDLKGDVLAVLKPLNATLPNVMSTEKDEAVYAQIDSYAVPVVEVYDRTGKLRKRFNEDQGEFTYEKDILPLVKELIAEKP